MTWDRAQKVLLAISLVAGGIGSTLLYQVLNRPPAVAVKQVRTVSIAPPPKPAPAEPARKAKPKPQPKQ